MAPGPFPLGRPYDRCVAASNLFRRMIPPDPSAIGTQPDYRFTLANERTFLAWIRTSLAIAAGGLGVVHLLPEFGGREVLGIGLLALSLVVAAASYRRWVMLETSMRLGETLPPSRLPALLAAATALVGVGAALLLLLDGAS